MSLGDENDRDLVADEILMMEIWTQIVFISGGMGKSVIPEKVLVIIEYKPYCFIAMFCYINPNIIQITISIGGAVWHFIVKNP